tara:strand:+ start:646 stop:1074 length:429 start_codon:yes stop_codon:yes gene_type:complete
VVDMKSLFIVLVILMLGTVACSNDDTVNTLNLMEQDISVLKAENAKLENALGQAEARLEEIAKKVLILDLKYANNVETLPNLIKCLEELVEGSGLQVSSPRDTVHNYDNKHYYPDSSDHIHYLDLYMSPPSECHMKPVIPRP